MSAQAELFKPENPIENLCRQKSVFSIISALVIAVLLLIHILFAPILGNPSLSVVMTRGLALTLAIIELAWLRRGCQRLTERTVKIESYLSISFLFLLTAVLTYITDRDESPYFVLLAIPILQCACVFWVFFFHFFPTTPV